MVEVVQDPERIKKKQGQKESCFQVDGAAYHKYCDEANDPRGSGPVK